MTLNVKSMELPVEKILKDRDITYRLVPLTDKAFTVADVMRLADGLVKAEEVGKTIIIRGKKTGQKVAVLLRGNDKLDFGAVKRLFGEEMSIASPEQVQEASGVEPGAVCPFLLTVPLYVDCRIFDLENLHCGSGDHLVGLEFAAKDLNKAVDYQVVELAK
ncbi:MAG: YbaK/EbsC family protein [Candidatus Komeilibacteria bacterium]|nr:YbaK/EbsC family protein [Candidatus Komeilibacteria bacterium]